MKFVHVATRTKDLEAAIKFYEQLGLTEKKRSELTKGKATLVFMAPEADNFAIELVYNWGKDDDYPAASGSATSPSRPRTSTRCCRCSSCSGDASPACRTCWRVTAHGSRSSTTRTATRSS